ncbi:MAG: winged helix-turn-helix domain-containing protein [Flavobacteriales bacterium]|jgi:DNA-binding transcriptional ArsR family regulator
MFKPLNPLLNTELRLAIMSLLIANNKAEFNFIKEKTGATAGNLSIQLQKLKDAKYLEIEKTFKGNYPLTTVIITKEGIAAFKEYIAALKTYFK